MTVGRPVITSAAFTGPTVELEWSYAGTIATGFRVERSEVDAPYAWQVIGTVGSTVYAYSDSTFGVVPVLHYRVVAMFGTREAASDPAVVVTGEELAPPFIAERACVVESMVIGT